MIDHPPVTIAEVSHELSHLSPFVLTVDSQLAQRALAVRVSFTNHCYTTQHDPAAHPDGWPVLRDGGGKARTFSPERYDLSKQMLPALIQQLNHPKAKVGQTQQRRNWVRSVQIDTTVGTYSVFFEMRKSRESAIDVEVIVESAYIRTEPVITVGTTGFILLCGKTFLGQKVATRR